MRNIIVRPRFTIIGSSPPASTGYPDASNTGVPAGTSLTVHNGDFTTSSNGQIINAMEIRGTLIVNHSNVVVTNTLIINSNNDWLWGVQCEGESTSVTLTDCTIDGQVNVGTCIEDRNYTLIRCDIKGAENGLDANHDVTMQDCFIHDLFNGGADPHADGVQINNGGFNMTFTHNTILSKGADGSDTTSCIISPQASTNPHDWLIEDNVFAGGAFSLYGPQNGTGTNVVIRNNKFWELYFTGKSGAFGSWTDASDETVSGNELGSFDSYDSVNKLIVGTWSGTPL